MKLVEAGVTGIQSKLDAFEDDTPNPAPGDRFVQ